MSDTNTTNPVIPTAAQLSESRLKQWHQQGEALLTIENLRSWINAAGLVLFTPRPQIVSPAPSLVEGVLGEPNASPTPAQAAEAKSLLARLVAEGLAVPLNLLGASGPGVSGATGDIPDFVCSTAVFSYVFTLRGDKAWKQPPATSGATKVSPLALAAYEAIARRGPISVYDLTTELGKEVTEAAVLRALGELWTHLRVLPLAQPDGGATLWELASSRFNKQIKAGANAGQPSALSALISLYLGQAIVASEEEIESFLSPLAARSRIRDVIHALLPARQLATIAVEGRTMLHVAGELPAFLAPEAPSEAETIPVAAAEGEAPAEEASGEPAPRITKYVPKPRKIGTGYLAKASPSKFAGKPEGRSFAAKPGFRGVAGSFKARGGTAFGSKTGPAPDRERRPFQKLPVDYAARGFDKPWEEEKARRLAAAARPSEVGGEAIHASASGSENAETQPRTYTPREGGSFDRTSKPSFGRKPAFGSRPSFGSKPSFSSDSRPPRREFNAASSGDGDARAPRKTFSKPGTFGRKREGFGGKPSFGSDSRPPRREFAPRTDRGDRPSFGGTKSFSGPRAPGSFAPKPRFDKPYGDRPQRPNAEGRDGGFAPRKPYPPRGAGFFSGKPRPSDNRPERSAESGAPPSGKRVYRKFDAPREPKFDAPRGDRPPRSYSSDRPARPARPEGSTGYQGKSGGFAGKKPFSRPGGGFAGKSGGGFSSPRPSGKPGGFAGKKPFGAGKSAGSFSSRPDSTFAKFAGNKKPFGNRPPAKKFKPRDESA